MICKNCGKEIGNAKFCNYCGAKNEPEVTPVNNTATVKRFCKNCGAEVKGNFCANCGTDNTTGDGFNKPNTQRPPITAPMTGKPGGFSGNKRKILTIAGICAGAIVALLIIIYAANPRHLTRKSRDLSTYIGVSESSLVKELNVKENSDGYYPSSDDDTFICIDGVVEGIGLTSIGGTKNDKLYNINGIKLGDNITNAQKKLADNFEPLFDNDVLSVLDILISGEDGFENAEAYVSNKSSDVLLVGYDDDSKITNLVLISDDLMTYIYLAGAGAILSEMGF